MLIPIFLDKSLASEKMALEDDFIKAQTQFNITLINEKLENKDQYREYLSKTTLDWEEAEIEKIKAIFVELNQNLKDKQLNINQEILLIRTNGEDSWNLPYTRQNAIILPSKQDEKEILSHNNIHLITHEVFHILSRMNPEVREALYRIYNFRKVPTIDVQSFIPSMITNPDALHFEYYTDVQYKNKTVKALPIMLFEKDKINWKKLLILDAESLKPLQLVNMRKTSYAKDKSLLTSYITHPEEISAEMFRILVLAKEDDKKSEHNDLLVDFHDVLKEFYK